MYPIGFVLVAVWHILITESVNSLLDATHVLPNMLAMCYLFYLHVFANGLPMCYSKQQYQLHKSYCFGLLPLTYKHVSALVCSNKHICYLLVIHLLPLTYAYVTISVTFLLS